MLKSFHATRFEASEAVRAASVRYGSPPTGKKDMASPDLAFVLEFGDFGKAFEVALR